MKPTKILLKEIEYGKNLFADDTPTLQKPHSVPSSFTNNITDFIGGEKNLEPNTEDENLLLTSLKVFTNIEGAYSDIPQTLANSAKSLLSLKSKFPRILDPQSTTGQSITSINSTPMVYRGATIPLSTFNKLNWGDSQIINFDMLYVENPGLEVSPRSERGIHSFTTSLSVAQIFAYRNAPRTKDTTPDRVEVIVAIPLDDPHLLFNPDFVDLVSEFKEREVLFVGNTFKPAYFLINDTTAYKLRIGPYKSEPLDGGVDSLLELESFPPLPRFLSNFSNFIGEKLFKVLLNRGNVEKLISELERVFFKHVSYDEEKVKIINAITNDLRNKVNTGKVTTLGQYFREMSKTQYDIRYNLMTNKLNKVKNPKDIVDNLLELEYGDNLLADKEPKISPKPPLQFSYQLPDFVGGNNALEDNTEDENKLISALGYFIRGGALNNDDLARDAKKLLSLKSKFPKILDPTLAKSTFSIGSSEMAFRGATIPLSTFEKLDWNNYTNPLGGGNTYALKNPGLKVSPRSGRGFHSFTSFINVALNFMDEIINSDYDKSRVPVIMCIPLNDPQLVFNPDFINLISSFREHETLFVGDTFEPEYFLVDDSIASKFKVGPYSSES